MKDKLTELVKTSGAHKVGVIDIKDVPFEPSLRQLCEMNTCGNFGKNWCCPPLMGNVDDCIKKLKNYSELLVFQCIYQLEDSFDFESMIKGKEDFRNLLLDIGKKLPEGTILLGAGGCGICPECAALDNEPCRFPDKQIAPIEGYGIQVSTLAEKCGMKYINGPNTVTYFGAVAY